MTPILTRVRQHLQAGDLAKLFVDVLGWDRHKQPLRVTVAGVDFDLRALAEKRGVQVFECPMPSDKAAMRAIEKEVTKSAFEHLIVFVNADRTAQTWQWVARHGQTPAYREVPWRKGQAGDALVQKLATLAVPLAEEEGLDLAGTVGKLRDAFDRDKVTKKF